MTEREPIVALRREIAPLREALLQHPVYDSIRSIHGLRVFMEHHAFAVWDFMTLLKSLQQQLTCVDVLWLPRERSFAARFVNEIVLAEETDEDGRGGYCSHFELYLRAMRECGANSEPLESFISLLGLPQRPLAQALGVTPPAVAEFVRQTLDTARGPDICRLAAAFTFGREDLLPDVFQRIVETLNGEVDGRLSAFEFYLRRHIELDGDHHGPMAERLIASLCGESESAWENAARGATAALQARLQLWDAIHAAVESADSPQQPLAK